MGKIAKEGAILTKLKPIILISKNLARRTLNGLAIVCVKRSKSFHASLNELFTYFRGLRQIVAGCTKKPIAINAVTRYTCPYQQGRLAGVSISINDILTLCLRKGQFNGCCSTARF